MNQHVKWEYLSPKCDGRKAWLQPGKRAALSHFKEEVGTNGEPEHSLVFTAWNWKFWSMLVSEVAYQKSSCPRQHQKIYKVPPWCNRPQILPLVLQCFSSHRGSHGSITGDTVVIASLGEGWGLGPFSFVNKWIVHPLWASFIRVGICIWSTHVWFYR